MSRMSRREDAVEDLSHPEPQVGAPVRVPEHVETPRRAPYEGRYVRLEPVDAEGDAPALYACSHGDPAAERLWTYLPYGPFARVADMEAWLRKCAASADTLFLTVHDLAGGRPVGMAAFLNVVPDALRLELGHIWYGPAAQRTRANTEAAYLMLREAFDHLGYRRAEWKCDSLNERSRAAALRLGFRYEGTFRQHMVRKGRNRDTAWFSMLDGEWPTVRADIERWLYDNADGSMSLTALNAGVSGER